MKSVWKDIAGFEGYYQVSNFGEVKALERTINNNGKIQKRREHILKQNTKSGMHCTVVLCKQGKIYPRLVHRLVAIAFIPNPENKPVVDHIDTDPHNNNVDNLRWVTTQENCMNPITRENNSRSKMGHPGYMRKLTPEEIEKIRQRNLGRKWTDEQKRILSEAHKNSPKSIAVAKENLKKAHQANTGKKRSEETKNKIREKLIGKSKGKHWKTVDGKRIYY